MGGGGGGDGGWEAAPPAHHWFGLAAWAPSGLLGPLVLGTYSPDLSSALVRVVAKADSSFSSWWAISVGYAAAAADSFSAKGFLSTVLSWQSCPVLKLRLVIGFLI